MFKLHSMISRAITLLLCITACLQLRADSGPLYVKYFQILKYRMGKDSAWQEPPRFYSIHFRGTSMKGWVEMNSHRQFHASWETHTHADHGSIAFTNTIASDYYVTRHDWTLENFEIAMTRLFLKLNTFDVDGDTLRLSGDGDMLCVQWGSLRQRVVDTWINDKDSTNVLSFENGKCYWMTIKGGDTSKVVYNYYAEDDRPMNGDDNLVCDYLELTNIDTMCSYDVVNAGSSLWMQSQVDDKWYSFTRLHIVKMKQLHAADRDSIVKICEAIPKLFIGPTNRKNALQTLTPPEDVLALFEYNHQDTSAPQQSLAEIRSNIHALYADSLPRAIDSTLMEGRRMHFNFAKNQEVWNVSASFIDRGDRHVAIAVITLADDDPETVAFEVRTQFILLNGKWYMLPQMERYPLSSYH